MVILNSPSLARLKPHSGKRKHAKGWDFRVTFDSFPWVWRSNP